MAAPLPTAPCAQHPGEAAGWSCTSCHAQLCPDCAAERAAGVGTTYTVCTLCGSPAEVLRIPRAEVPLMDRLSGAWRYPLNANGLVAMLASGVVLWACNAINRPGLGQAILCGYVFALIRAVANGSRDIQPPDFTDLSEDIIRPGRRGFLATSFVWVPLVLYYFFGPSPHVAPPPEEVETADVAARWRPPPGVELDQRQERSGRPTDEAGQQERQERGEGAGAEAPAPGDPAGAEAPPGAKAAPRPRSHRVGASASREVERVEEQSRLEQMFRSPLVWLILLVGLAFIPMSLVVSASGGDALDMLNPYRLVRYIARFPRDYALVLGAMAMITIAYVVASALGVTIRRVPIPFFPGLLAESLRNYVPFVAAYVLGSLVYLRGAALDLLPQNEGWEYALPGAVPRGVSPELNQAAAPGGSTSFTRPSAIELDGDSSGLPLMDAPGPSLPQRIADALQQRQDEVALDLYRAAEGDPAEIAPLDHFNVGRAAATKGDYPLALRALQAAAKANPADALAPRAFVLMGRILGERMGDTARAARVFQHIVQHYPQSEAARFARERLTSKA